MKMLIVGVGVGVIGIVYGAHIAVPGWWRLGHRQTAGCRGERLAVLKR